MYDFQLMTLVCITYKVIGLIIKAYLLYVYRILAETIISTLKIVISRCIILSFSLSLFSHSQFSLGS